MHLVLPPENSVLPTPSDMCTGATITLTVEVPLMYIWSDLAETLLSKRVITPSRGMWCRAEITCKVQGPVRNPYGWVLHLPESHDVKENRGIVLFIVPNNNDSFDYSACSYTDYIRAMEKKF